MYHILFLFGLFSSLVLSVSGLQITFPNQPVAASNNTYSWTRDRNDPADFFLQKVKLDDEHGQTGRSDPVIIPNVGGSGGSGQIFFHRAGIFQIFAVDFANGKDFFNMALTVQANPTSAGANPQQTGSGDGPGSGDGSGHGNCKKKNCGDDNQRMNSQDGQGSDSNSSKASKAKSDVPAIVGIVLGIAAFIFLVVAILVYLRYRRRRQTNNFERNMMVRSPISVNPWMTSQSLDPEKKDYFYRNSEYSPNALSPPGMTAYLPSLPPGLEHSPVPPMRSVSVGSSVSQRRPNEPKGPRSRNSGTTVTTLTLTSSGSANTSSKSESMVEFPIPSFPSRSRTSRQIMIEEDIQRLQGELLALQAKRHLTGVDAIERDEQLKEVTSRVERLKEVHEGPWALGQTETIPSGLF